MIKVRKRHNAEFKSKVADFLPLRLIFGCSKSDASKRGCLSLSLFV